MNATWYNVEFNVDAYRLAAGYHRGHSRTRREEKERVIRLNATWYQCNETEDLEVNLYLSARSHFPLSRFLHLALVVQLARDSV